MGMAMTFTPSAASGSVSAQDEPETRDEDKVVCKRFAVTGTRVKKRVCRTQAAWDEIARQSREDAQGIHDAGGVNSVRPDGG